MPLVLIKEDGTGRSDANSYASAADGDGYFDGHLYASAWTGASTGNKEKALVMATRLIDSQYQFNGFRSNTDQALQWPRQRCPDPDSSAPVLRVGSVQVFGGVGPSWLASDEVPKAVSNATCEMAKELLLLDRTTAPPGEGIQSLHTGHTDAGVSGNAPQSDNTSTVYSKMDVRPIISHVAQAMLAKYGGRVGAGGVAKVVRT